MEMCNEKGRYVFLFTFLIISSLSFIGYVTWAGINYHNYVMEYNSTIAKVTNYTYISRMCYIENTFFITKVGSYKGCIIFDYNNGYQGSEEVSCGISPDDAISKARLMFPLNTTFDIHYEINNPKNWLLHYNIVTQIIISGVLFCLALLLLALLICHCNDRRNKYKVID